MAKFTNWLSWPFNVNQLARLLNQCCCPWLVLLHSKQGKYIVKKVANLSYRLLCTCIRYFFLKIFFIR